MFIYLFIGERSERGTYRGKNEKIGDVCWRASVASETVLGVDNAKSGICYMYICMWDGTYAPLKRARGTFFSKQYGFLGLTPVYSLKQQDASLTLYLSSKV